MPVYSVSRTNQYTTTAAVQSAANQSFMFYDGFQSRSYGTLFTVNNTTICPSTNLAYNYTNPNSLTSDQVWYPYSFTLAICGGNPDNQGSRSGFAWFKLWSSAGSFLMGNNTATPTLSQQNAGVISLTISTNNIPVLATTQLINNSRNSITTSGSTTDYIIGFTNTTTVTEWTIVARKSGQTTPAQTIYQDTSTGTTSSAISTATTFHTTSSMMGFITYNNAPVQPTSFTVTTTATGISYSCQGDEVNSLASGTTVGAVSTVKILYSTVSGSGYSVIAPTTFTRTLVAGTTYSYTGTLTTTLTNGTVYYFKIATVNDAALAYNANGGSAPSAEVSAVFGTPPQLFYVRNTGNSAWSNVAVGARNAGNTGWTHTPVYKRDPTNTFWIGGATQTSGVVSLTTGSGKLGNLGNATTSGTAVGGFPVYTIAWTYVSGVSCSLVSATGNPTSTATWSTTATSGTSSTVQMAITDTSGQTASGTTTIAWTRTAITAMSFTLNGVAFTTNQSRTAGTTYTIAVSSVTPAAATYSPTSQAQSTAGTYSLTSSGTGAYQGSFTSPTLTITAAISGSITENTSSTITTRNCTATLTGATATGYSWSRISGTVGTISSPASQTTNINGSGTTTSVFQCTISYAGGSVSPTISITWNLI